MNFFDVWAGLIALWLLVVIYRSWRFVHHLPRLGDTPVPGARTAWPKISMIISACNEAGTMQGAARSLLATDYPNIEFIFVDDRSTDATGRIIDELAREDARVKPVYITELPAGWLGKVHAVAKGTERAAGEWILVTDADVHYAPDCLRKAVCYCETESLDFLTVFPFLVAKTAALRVFLAHFMHLVAIFMPIQHGRGMAGVGAFLFFRREILLKSEGFQWIRLEIIDDMGTAYLLKRAGARMGMVDGYDQLRLEWYANFPALVRGLEKNFFAVIQYSVAAVLILLAAILFASGGAFVAPFFASSRWFGVLLAAELFVTFASLGWLMRRGIRLRFWEPFLTPLAFLILPYIAMRSAAITLWNGGVRWRTTFYPLQELRAHHRLNIWRMHREAQTES